MCPCIRTVLTAFSTDLYADMVTYWALRANSLSLGANISTVADFITLAIAD